MVVAKCSDESTRVVAKTSAMRPLKRSDHAVGLWGSGLDQAMFDVVGGADLIEGMGAGRRRSPVAQKRSVTSLPLSVRTLLMVNGTLSIRRLRKPLVVVADLSLRNSTYTQRVARSMAANR